jgi:hypothetical protein
MKKLPIVEVSTEEKIYSPFSGQPVYSEETGETNIQDSTLLFVYYGNSGDYDYISDKVIKLIPDIDVIKINVEDLPELLSIDGGFMMVVDSGWNGINYYGFAP